MLLSCFSIFSSLSLISLVAGSYTGVSATGGDGSGATFDVVVDGSGVPTVTLNYEGQNYAKDNSLTITDALLGGGGASNIVINVTSVEDGAEAAGYWGDGVVVNITVKNQGSGYSATTDDPRAYIANVHRIDTLKITEGISEEDAGIEPHYNRLRTAGTFPEMVNAMDRTEDKAVDASRKKAYQSKSTTSPQPNSESLTDFSKNDIYTLPQRRYAKDKVDKYAEFILKYGVEGVNDVKDMTVKTSNVSPEYKKEMANYRKKTKEAEETRVQSIKTQVKALAQESVPEYLNYSGTLVETVQRRFSDLPHASTLTKYHMRQYRASSTDKMDIKVTIGCKLNESGCGHINCNAPAVSAGSTTNNNDGSTTTKTYTMSGLLGPGAEDWEATGTLRVLNDLTAATYNMGKCVEAYGNPFDI